MDRSFKMTCASACLLLPTAAWADPDGADFQARCRALRAEVGTFLQEQGPQAQIHLVLGATTQEAGRFMREPAPAAAFHKWIFLSREAHTGPRGAGVRMDFNDGRRLFQLSRILAGKVSSVVFDHSVIKFTAWNRGHLTSIRDMLSPKGTFFLPVETWGATAFGMDPEGTPLPSDCRPPTGVLEVDARTYSELTQEVMANGARALAARRAPGDPAPPVLPTVLRVPRNWGPDLDEATRGAALALWMSTFHIPALVQEVHQAGFASATPVRITPRYLADHPEAKRGLACLACKP